MHGIYDTEPIETYTSQEIVGALSDILEPEIILNALQRVRNEKETALKLEVGSILIDEFDSVCHAVEGGDQLLSIGRLKDWARKYYELTGYRELQDTFEQTAREVALYVLSLGLSDLSSIKFQEYSKRVRELKEEYTAQGFVFKNFDYGEGEEI